MGERDLTKTTLFIFLIAILAFPGILSAGELDLGLSYHDGIDTKKGIDLASKNTWDNLSVGARFRYADQNDEISENQGYLHLGYDPRLTDHWSLWFFDRLGYDRKREITGENFLGVGPKYRVVHNDKWKISLSAGPLLHNIRYENDETDDLIRLSFRPKVAWQIRDYLSFEFVAFYQPDIADFDDYIVMGEASLKYSLDKWPALAFKLKVEDTYRSVSQIREKNDLTTGLALSLSF